MLDLGGHAMTFFQYRDVNLAYAYRPDDVEPETLRTTPGGRGGRQWAVIGTVLRGLGPRGEGPRRTGRGRRRRLLSRGGIL